MRLTRVEWKPKCVLFVSTYVRCWSDTECALGNCNLFTLIERCILLGVCVMAGKAIQLQRLFLFVSLVYVLMPLSVPFLLLTHKDGVMASPLLKVYLTIEVSFFTFLCH